MSQITPAVRRAVVERDGGMCVRCPRARPYNQVHHRRPRGMGSSDRGSTNQPSNLISLCLSCHSWVESNRAEALALGYLVLQSQEPSEVPVVYRGRITLLSDDATVRALL